MTLSSITKPMSKLVGSSSSKSGSKEFGPEDKHSHVPETPLVYAPSKVISTASTASSSTSKTASTSKTSSSVSSKSVPPRTPSGSPSRDSKVLSSDKAESIGKINAESKSSPRSVKQIDSDMPSHPRSSIKDINVAPRKESATPTRSNVKEESKNLPVNPRRSIKEERPSTQMKDEIRHSTATSTTAISSESTETKLSNKKRTSVTSLGALSRSANDDRTVGESSLASKDPPGRVNVPTTITVSEHERSKEHEADDDKVTLSDENSSSKVDDKVPEFALQEQYGLDANPNEEHHRPTLDIERRKAQALCFCIGAEGVYTKEQEEWLMGLLTTTGYDQSIVNAIPSMLKEASKLLELELAVEAKRLIKKDMRDGSTILIYDAFRCAAVADFPNEQMCAIAMIAEEIGVNKFGHLDEIRKQVVAEEELKKQRIKLLFPEGHECLDEKYEGEVKSETNTVDDNSKKSMGESSRNVSGKSGRKMDP